MYGSAQTWRPARNTLCWMRDDTVYTRTFRRAIESLGGAGKLAAALGATVVEIEAWAAGLADPPPGMFLKAIDVVAHSGYIPSIASGKS
jgi:hypothetical protein